MSIPPPPAVVDSRSVAAQLDQVLREAPGNIGVICQLGNAAHRLGDVQARERAFSHATDLLLRCIRAGDANAALAVEGMVYHAFVKAVEDEAHYESCFARWREPMAELGRRFRHAVAPAAGLQGRRIGFVFHNGVVLGHTEVLFRLIESADRKREDPRIYVMWDCSADFLARAKALGVAVEAFPESPGAPAGIVPRLQWLREKMAADGVPCAVWVSVPMTALFTGGMRVAPVQVFWSLRYHPVRSPDFDGYLTYGSWAESERVFHGQRWTVCPVPLALDPRPVSAQAVAQLRARFPHRLLLGSLAREEKLDSRPYLESIAEILRANPAAGFLWTGHARHPGIAAFFAQQGLAARAHFVGWVDTALYAAALDLFLETFPLGCGITGYQALAAGVPLLSYLDANTVFGMQYWSELMNRAGTPANVTREQLDAYPVLCARNPAEYVQLASRMLHDGAFREAWRAREAGYFEAEIAGIERYSRRFFDALHDITARTLPR
jgi:hypothetical protein